MTPSEALDSHRQMLKWDRARHHHSPLVGACECRARYAVWAACLWSLFLGWGHIVGPIQIIWSAEYCAVRKCLPLQGLCAAQYDFVAKTPESESTSLSATLGWQHVGLDADQFCHVGNAGMCCV